MAGGEGGRGYHRRPPYGLLDRSSWAVRCRVYSARRAPVCTSHLAAFELERAARVNGSPTSQPRVTLVRIEACEGTDTVSGALKAPLITIYGRDRRGEPLALSVRRSDFEVMVRWHREQGMRSDMARCAVALSVLRTWDSSLARRHNIH